MNVINKQKKKFIDVRLGDLIEYDADYFLVIQDVLDCDQSDAYNVVNVKTGLGYYFHEHEEVIVCDNAEIVMK